MSITTPNKKVRYVTTGGIVHFTAILSELMQRNNSGQTTPDRMLQAQPVLMNKSLGMAFRPIGLPSTRVAWMVSSSDTMKWLVWFGNDGFADTVDDGQGNHVPQPQSVRSACFLRIEAAFEALEEYLLTAHTPINLMPEGHLATLTG